MAKKKESKPLTADELAAVEESVTVPEGCGVKATREGDFIRVEAVPPTGFTLSVSCPVCGGSVELGTACKTDGHRMEKPTEA